MPKFNLSQFQKDHTLKQKEIVKILSVSQPFLSAIKNGERPLPPDKYELLTKRFGDLSKYVDEPKSSTLIQQNQNGDNIGGDKILQNSDDREKMVLQAKIDALESEIARLYSLIRELTLQ